LPASRSKRTRSLADLARVEAALERALQEALGLHMRLGHAVPEWAEDHLVWVQPSELLKNGNGHARKQARKKSAARAKRSRRA
jgi:hypothetical protein